jgi:hypothetical protein
MSARKMFDSHFSNPKPSPTRKDRDKTVHLSIQFQLVEYLSTECL